MLPPEILNARGSAAMSLTIMAGTVSARLDSFGWWFLAAVGAALSLFISNLTQLQTFLPTEHLLFAGSLFIWAAILYAVQRYLSVIVTGAAETAKAVFPFGEKFHPMDFPEFFSQMECAYPKIMRGLLRGQFKAILSGDLAAGARMLVRFALIQGLFIVAEIIVLLVALNHVLQNIQA